MTNGTEAFYLNDGLNRPVALVTSAGVASTYAYDPYGVTTTGGTGAAGGQNPYRFAPGSLYDRTTDMLKYGQRWYQPVTGRFTQQDSITHLANPQQGNKYAYAGDDPINSTDPTGRCNIFEALGSFFGFAGTSAAGSAGEIIGTAYVTTDASLAFAAAAAVPLLGIGIIAGVTAYYLAIDSGC